jgi:hypothetical protein
MKSYLASRLFTQTQILGETYDLEDLIGILLRYLRKSAEEQFGDLGSGLVVGRPVHFSGAKEPQKLDALIDLVDPAPTMIRSTCSAILALDKHQCASRFA